MDIQIIIGVLFGFAAVFYLLVHIGLITGLKRTNKTSSLGKPYVSIIVAARNEEQTIGSLIQCLLKQTYHNYEIIIVNDRSTDKTGELIADFQKSHPSIIRIDIDAVPKDMPAKKNALRAGIESSSGEILCFTDADCFPPPAWIEKVVEQFAPEVGLVAGYSPYQTLINGNTSENILQKTFLRFIAYEEFRAAVWSVGSIGWNLGWLCTGRNLAYRRKVYDELDGFEKIKMSISGDDDLFLQLVRRFTDWEIKYVLSKESFVPTIPPEGFWSFVEQRKRHFSAAKYFSFPMKLFFFFYHSSNLLLFFSPIVYALNILSLPAMIICVCSKLFADVILFSSSYNIFAVKRYNRSFILMEALYLFYNSFIGPLGIIRKFEWK